MKTEVFLKKYQLFLKYLRDENNFYFKVIPSCLFILTICFIIIFTKYNIITDYSSVLAAILVTIWLVSLSSIIEYSFKRIISNRPSSETYLNTVKYELRMMGISLYNIHSDKKISEIIKKKFVSKNSLSESINEIKIRNNKDFRFILIDPFSKALKDRAEEEGKCENKLKLECLKTIKRFEEIISDEDVKKENDGKRKKFEYRLYSRLPKHSVIFTDEYLLVGPYLIGLSGYNSKWIRFTNYKAIKQYDEEFDEIWNDEKYTKKREQISNEFKKTISKISDPKIDELLKEEYVSDAMLNNLFKESNLENPFPNYSK